MDDLKALLEQTASAHTASEDALRSTIRRAERRRTRNRVIAGIVAFAVAGLGIGTAFVTLRRSTVPSSPAGQCGSWIRREGPPSDGFLTRPYALDPADVWVLGGGSTHHAAIFHWDGTGWRTVTTPYLESKYNPLSGIGGAASDDLWAVGVAFPGQSDRISHPIALHWDGDAWTLATLPSLPGTQGALVAVAAVASDDVWAAGWFGDKGSHRSLIEHWDGQAWSVVSIPNASDRYAGIASISETSATDVWAVGIDAGQHFSNTVLHWDGNAWKRVDVPPLRIPTGAGVRPLVKDIVALTPDDVWIAAEANETVKEGNHLRSLGSSPYFVHWDGKRWTRQRPAMPRGSTVQLNAMAGGPLGLWAVGLQQGGAPVTEPIIYGLLGNHWELVPSPTIPPAPLHMDDFRMNQLFSVSVDPMGNAWALGTFFTSKGDSDLPLVESYCPAP
jgi:hypothetical protein